MTTIIRSLIVKVAERCNLNCSYCYMYNLGDQSYLARPKFMSGGIYTAMLQRIGEYCAKKDRDPIDLTFHGGEPLLIGKKRFEAMVIQARETLGDALASIQVQTNATLIDHEWARLFYDLGIAVGVSMDGPEDVHDSERVDHQGRGSHAKVLQGLEHLQKYDLASYVLCVVNPRHSGLSAYRHFRDLGIDNINFLLPDINLDTRDTWYGDCGETPVANYLIPIFDAWFSEDDPNVRLKIFRQLIGKILGRNVYGTDSFGNPPIRYLIIESDGTIQPLDVLRACDPGLIDTKLNIAQHGFDDLHLGPKQFHELYENGSPPCQTCQACPEFNICGGGYLPHRFSKANGFDNPSAWCEDIKAIVSHIRERLGVAVAV